LKRALTDASMWEYRLPSKGTKSRRFWAGRISTPLFPLYFAKEEVNNPGRGRLSWHSSICSWRKQIVYADCGLNLNCCGKPVPANLSEKLPAHLVGRVATRNLPEASPQRLGDRILQAAPEKRSRRQAGTKRYCSAIPE